MAGRWKVLLWVFGLIAAVAAVFWVRAIIPPPDGDASDQALAAPQAEFDGYTARWTGFDPDGPATAAATRAFRDFERRPQNAYYLFRASALYLAARSLDLDFETDPLSSPMCGKLLTGWRKIQADEGPRFARMRFLFMAFFSVPGHFDREGLALLERNPRDGVVARAYIAMVYGRVGSDDATRLRCIRLADELVDREPERPSNWLARSIAYWCAPNHDASSWTALLKACRENGEKYKSMLPSGCVARKKIENWLQLVRRLQTEAKQQGRTHRSSS